MNNLSWPLVKLLHEERVNEMLQLKRADEARRASRPVRKFRLFETRRKLGKPDVKKPVNEPC
jgi:hypothetical protein